MSFVVQEGWSTEIYQRADFPKLLNARGLLTIGVEIGVDRGIYAKEILTTWQGRELYCCDPWQPYHEMPWEREGDMLLAAINLAPFGDRVRLVRCLSHTLQETFVQIPRPLCFVYIDGDHTYDAVSWDIRMWWEVLQPNGILAGHDFSDFHPEVRRAVREFAKYTNRPIRFTRSPHEPGTWYLYKTEPTQDLIDVTKES